MLCIVRAGSQWAPKIREESLLCLIECLSCSLRAILGMSDNSRWITFFVLTADVLSHNLLCYNCTQEMQPIRMTRQWVCGQRILLDTLRCLYLNWGIPQVRICGLLWLLCGSQRGSSLGSTESLEESWWGGLWSRRSHELACAHCYPGVKFKEHRTTATAFMFCFHFETGFHWLDKLV